MTDLLTVKFLIPLVLNILFFSTSVASAAPVCSSIFSSGMAPYQMVLSDREATLRDLEPIFKRLIQGETFELVIPKGYKLNLFPSDPPYSVRHTEKEVGYFPYHLGKADSDDARYMHDQLESLQSALLYIERSQKKDLALGDVWKLHLGGRFFFTRSPTSAKSSGLFQRQDRLLSIIERTKQMGRPPFLYVKENGDMVLTNEHFVRHLKRTGHRSLYLYRGHHSFDYFYYNLLLGKAEDIQELRLKFATWMNSRIYNIAIERNVTREWLREIAGKLESESEPIDDILFEMAHKLTTSAMFTSLSSKTSTYWSSTARAGEISEVVELKVDLEKMPASYLEQIIYGSDLEVEVVLPYATRDQMEALKAAVTIQRIL